MAIEPPSYPAKVKGTVNYKPVDGSVVVYAGTAKEKLRKWDAATVQLNDLRACAEQPTLEENGFELRRHQTQFDFESNELLKTTYFSECADLVKEATGASRVICFSFVRRRHSHEEAVEDAKNLNPDENLRVQPPASYAHVDESFDGAVYCLRDNLPEGADMERLTRTRWAIINVWRPFAPVTRDPLAICDSKSVAASDLCPTKMVFPKVEESFLLPKGAEHEFYLVRNNPNHRWYYTSKMQPDEVYLLKIFDTKLDGRARCVPHTAVQTEVDHGPARQSIDIRCLVFWEDQPAE